MYGEKQVADPDSERHAVGPHGERQVAELDSERQAISSDGERQAKSYLLAVGKSKTHYPAA